jgi:hypothetical protein
MDYKHYQEEDFEQFLHQEVDDYRMYPSDQVWKNIRVSIHGTQTWHALTFIALSIICGLTISTVVMLHRSKSFKRPDLLTANLLPKKLPLQSVNNTSASPKMVNYFEAMDPENITEETIAAIQDQQILALPKADPTTNHSQETTIPSNHIIDHNTVEHTVTSALNTDIIYTANADLPGASLLAANNKIESTIPQEKPNLLNMASDADKKMMLQNDYLKNIVPKRTMTWKKVSKIGIQFYAAASKSYRTLTDADVKEIIQPNSVSSKSAQTVPMALNYSANVNDIVRHSPATGLEIGVASLYNISRRFKLKTGIQLNIQQYHIEAFKTATKDLNTIDLINNNGIQTINISSFYNNNTGYKSEQLNNKNYQISVPIGIQWEIAKRNNIGLNAEAAVQPSYLLTNSTYVLSTDFKNYTDGNGLLRKWNINTNIGINISYKSGSNLIQFGPQIRYQHLPSYTNQYPIKEHLMEYGIKLGITRQWR